MKNLFILISFIFSSLFPSCTVDSKKLNRSKGQQIIEALNEAYPDDNFYFIYGIDKEGSIATNIRYRAIIYSDKLAELNYPSGLEIAVESLPVKEATLRNIVKAYEYKFWTIEFENMVQNRAKELFGEKCNFQINWTMTLPKYRGLKKLLNSTQEVPREEKYGSQNSIVNVFVEDLENLDIEEYKQKTFELSKYIYNYMNYVTSLQIYVRDDSYFENYDLVKASIYKAFREREDISTILEKIENNKGITDGEKVTLIRSFRKGGLDFNLVKFRCFDYFISDIKAKEELTFEKVLNTEIIDRRRK